MNSALRELIALSLILGLSLHLCPEGGVRQVLTVLSAALLGISVLSSFKGLDYDALALGNAKLREAERTITEDGERTSQKLNRLLIEEEYASYIRDRAESIGVGDLEVQVQVQWSYEGFWLPYAAHITGTVEPSKQTALERMIRDELGIPTERQYWYSNG
ncbi:MAG: hypothetical protein Q4E45_10600 [Eubacteriales bacterium]|nr:hypothetical protein [Eubacteriales bacterium]